MTSNKNKKYALVEIPREKNKRIIVETCNIYDFYLYGALTKNNVYHYDDGKAKFKCVILYLSDLYEVLSSENLRIRKLVINNPSALSTSEDSEEELSVVKAREARKKQKVHQMSIKKQKTDDIIDQYKKHRKKSYSKIFRESDSSDSSKKDRVEPRLPDDYDEILHQKSDLSADHEQISNTNTVDTPTSHQSKTEKNIIISETDGSSTDMFDDGNDTRNQYVEPNVVVINQLDSHEDGTKSNDDDKKVSKTSSGPKNNSNGGPIITKITNLDTDKLIKRLMEDNRMKDETILKLKRERQEWRLQAASAQQKLRQCHQQHPQQQQQAQQQQQLQQQQQDQRFDPYRYLTHKTFEAGDDVRVPSYKSQSALNAKTPAKFIQIMSHAMWGVETLSNRVVRSQKNTGDRPELTPRKKELLQISYQHYLKQQNFSPEQYIREAQEITVNTYLDRAIQSAKKIVNKTK